MEHREEGFAAQATTSSFVDLDEVIDKRGCRSAVVVLTNTDGANTASFQMLGSIDQTLWAVIAASADIAPAAVASAVITDPWPFFKVQIKDKVGGSHASVQGAASVLAD